MTTTTDHDDVAQHTAAFRLSIPDLSGGGSHKGQHGRVGVIGGSREYTGAPFFAAVSALRAGADLSHVFCAADAAAAIKAYSPELIVHPVLDRSNAVDYLTEWMDRLHVLVIGPGLGRSEHLLPLLQSVVDKAKSKGMPLVFDADGLHFVNSKPALVHGYTKAILTPNAVEFSRLYATLTGTELRSGGRDPQSAVQKSVELATRMGNVTLLVKGPQDIVTNGQVTVISREAGSGRRCGGQGDILSGVLGTFSCWSNKRCPQAADALVTACVAASLLTRCCNAMAFRKQGRAMLTSDMLKFIGKSFELHFGP